jgi:hypothetical protein
VIQIKRFIDGKVIYESNCDSLREAFSDLQGADLHGANLQGADLREAKNLVKIMGVEIGNTYWKRFSIGLNNQGYQYKVGVNKLRDLEVFAFASKSWRACNYPDRPLEAKIRIPEGAQINEPWATDGKASADMIEILQVFDVETGKDITDKYR